MGLSRRIFTKEFKLAAVRRLELPLPPTRPVRSRGVISQSQSSNRSLWPKRFPAPCNWIMKGVSKYNSTVRVMAGELRPWWKQGDGLSRVVRRKSAVSPATVD